MWKKFNFSRGANNSGNIETVNTDRTIKSYNDKEIIELDLKKDSAKELKNIVQLNLSYSKDIDRGSTCILYLNYGGWIRSESSNTWEYLKKEFNSNGYSFAVLTARDRRDMKTLLGGAPEEVPRMYEISKIINLLNESKNIPVLIIQGSHDSMMPVEPARRLYNEMKKRNMKISYLELPLVEHAFDNMFAKSSIVGLKVKREIRNWMEEY